jgi:uncharacterized protein YxjI
LSVRGAIEVADQDGDMAYHGKGELALFSARWRVYRGDSLVGSIRRRVFAWTSTWDIDGDLGNFVIKRKLFSLSRKYYAIGGSLDGATITGNLWDFRFRVSRGEETLARAARRILSIRDRIDVEVTAEPELFVVFAMLVLQLDRRDERRRDKFEQESRLS